MHCGYRILVKLILIKQLKKDQKTILRLQRDSNPSPPRYWCDALPTELWNLVGSRLVVHSLKMKSLPLAFPRKKSSLLKKDLPAVNNYFSLHDLFVFVFKLIYYQLFWSGSLYATCLLRSIAIPNVGNCTSHQNLELIQKQKKTSLNSGQILWKWSHCLFHFRERRARFSKTIFLQLIFSALSPLLIFRLIYFQLFWRGSLYVTCLLRSIATPNEIKIVLLINIWNSYKKENLSQLGSNSLKMKSLPLSFPRKKSSLLKNNLPTVNIFRFITLAYFSTDIFSAILKLQLVSDMPFAIDCNPNDANWATHQNLKLIGQKSQLGSNSQKMKSLPISFPRRRTCLSKRKTKQTFYNHNCSLITPFKESCT